MTELLMVVISLILVGFLGWAQVRYSVPPSKERLFRWLWDSMAKRVDRHSRHCAGNKTCPTVGEGQSIR